jgi:F-box-like
MSSESLLHSYINNNEPLPDDLRQPLDDCLVRLDALWQTCQKDKEQVVDAIDSRLAVINSLHREIDALSRVQGRYVKWQSALDAKRKRYMSSIAVVRHIPPEVVAKFIKYAIEDPDGFIHEGERHIFAQLRAVCRLWRQTSLSTPSLWRRVGVNMGQALGLNSDTDTKSYVRQNLAPWFLRAGKGAPLALYVQGLLPDMVSDLMDFVRNTSFSFKAVTLSGSGMDSDILLPYTVFETISPPASIALPIKYLGVVFRTNPRAVNQPTTPPGYQPHSLLPSALQTDPR